MQSILITKIRHLLAIVNFKLPVSLSGKAILLVLSSGLLSVPESTQSPN